MYASNRMEYTISAGLPSQNWLPRKPARNGKEIEVGCILILFDSHYDANYVFGYTLYEH